MYPVPVTNYKGIYCSICGAPLEKGPDDIYFEFEFKEMKFPRYNSKKQNASRENKRENDCDFPVTDTRNGRFIVTHNLKCCHNLNPVERLRRKN